MRRLLPLLFLLPLLLGQHWETSVPAPVAATDDPTTTQIEIKSNSDIEIHLDEDNDGDGYGSLYIYSGANDLECTITDTGTLSLAGTTISLDDDNTGAVATGVGIEIAPNTSGTPITMKTAAGPDLTWAGATEYNYDAKVNHPATRKETFTPDQLSVDTTVCKVHAVGVALSSGGPPADHVIYCQSGANNGYIYGMMYLPEDFDASTGGDFFFRFLTMNDNASPSGLLRGVINAQCVDAHDGDEAVSATWTAYDNLTTGYNTQYHIEPFNHASVLDPDGTCEANDLLVWRLVVCQTTNDNCAAASTTQETDVHFLLMRIEFPTTGAE